MNNGYYQQQGSQYGGGYNPNQNQYGPTAWQQQQYAYGNGGGYNNNYPNPNHGPFDSGPSGKSRGVAGLLALLVGGFGAHYFYCDKIAGGFLCFLLTIVTCGIFGIIILIQGILFFTMSEQEFENKWVRSTSTMPFF